MRENNEGEFLEYRDLTFGLSSVREVELFIPRDDSSEILTNARGVLLTISLKKKGFEESTVDCIVALINILCLGGTLVEKAPKLIGVDTDNHTINFSRSGNWARKEYEFFREMLTLIAKHHEWKLSIYETSSVDEYPLIGFENALVS